jgi:hypothetical protein
MSEQPCNDRGSAAYSAAVRATLEIDGDSLKDVVNRLYDIAQRLDDPARTLPVQMVGGHHIVTVREADKAPKIDWREAEGA